MSTGNLFLHGPYLHCIEDKRSEQQPYTLSSIIIQIGKQYINVAAVRVEINVAAVVVEGVLLQ
jgi:hypothetical protein